MNTIEKIRTEIERLNTQLPEDYTIIEEDAYYLALDRVLSFLDTLEQEQPLQNQK